MFRCKGGESPYGSLLVGKYPGWPDCEIEVVTDDGERIALPDVDRVVIVAKAGAEPVTAYMTVTPGEVDLEGLRGVLR